MSTLDSRGRLGAGWGAALRIAWRDALAAKGRTALVVTLIGLPVLVLVAGLVVATTANLTPAERLPGEIGATQGSIDAWSPARVEQYSNAIGESGTATPLPTPLAPGDSDPRHLATAVAPLLPKAHLVPVGRTGFSRHDGRRVLGEALAIDPADAARPALAPLTRLVSGRHPTGPDEMAATELGVARGMPTSGTTRLRLNGAPARPMTVVGVVASASDADALVTFAAAPAANGRVLVDRAEPLTWEQTRRLNDHGLYVTSRAVVTAPPDEYRSDDPGAEAATVAVSAALLAGLLLEMCLLAGPAFAIGAQRQRRALALAASNGATRRQLRAVVLAQALVLGVLTAAAATVLGVLTGAFVALPLAGRLWPSPELRAAPDVPWGYVVGIGLMAGVACIVAALVPARGLGRLDVVTVLRGGSASPRPHRGLPVLGLALAAVGGVVTVAPIVSRSDSPYTTPVVVAGAFLLVIGAIMLVPTILAALGRLTRRLPVSARMATRDATRRRGRAVPTAASLIGGAALLAAAGTASSSAVAAEQRDYSPQQPTGWALLSGPDVPDGRWDEAGHARDLRDAARVAATAVPGARAHLVGTAGQESTAAPSGSTTQQVALSCPLAETRRLATTAVEDGGAAVDRCIVLATVGALPGAGVDVVDADVAQQLYHLDDAATAALAAGEALVTTPGATHGTLPLYRVVTTDVETTPQHTWTAAGSVTVRPAYAKAVPPQFGPWNGTGAIVSTATANRLGWPVVVRSALLEKPGGIDEAEEATLDGALADAGLGTAEVERGWRNSYVPVLTAMYTTIGLLSVVAVVVASALSVRESRRDLEILTAVGASPGTRRRFSAWQAGFLAGVGTLLGYAIGLVPGIALCWPLTSHGPIPTTDGTVEPAAAVIVHIPWGPLALTLVSVCLIASLVAALAAGREQHATRRLA